MLLNFYLKSSKCLPLFFFVGPIPSSPLNSDVLGKSVVTALFKVLFPPSERRRVGLCLGEEKDHSLRGDEGPTVERKVPFLAGAQLASQTKRRCPTASSHLKPAPPRF